MLATCAWSEKGKLFAFHMVFKKSILPNFGLLLKMFGVQHIVEFRVDFY